MAQRTTTENDIHPEQMAAAILELARSIGGREELLHETLDKLRGAQPERVISFGDVEYQAKLREANKPFPRPVYQNQFEANPSGLSDETLQKVGELVPGTFLGGHVTIEAVQNNGIVFRYKTRSVEQRMANERVFRSFTELVEKCWQERHA